MCVITINEASISNKTEDDIYIYSFPYEMSKFVKVVYSNGLEENIKDALKSGKVEPDDLDRFDIKYYKNKK